MRKSKKKIRLISKPTTLHVNHTNFYISFPSLRDYNVKSVISRFIEVVNKQERDFLFFSELRHGS